MSKANQLVLDKQLGDSFLGRLVLPLSVVVDVASLKSSPIYIGKSIVGIVWVFLKFIFIYLFSFLTIVFHVCGFPNLSKGLNLTADFLVFCVF